jgi:hypothetical protein
MDVAAAESKKSGRAVMIQISSQDMRDIIEACCEVCNNSYPCSCPK